MLEKKNIKGNYLWFSLFLFAFLGIYQLWKTQKAPIGDFTNYYFASRLYLDNQFDQQVYDPYTFNLKTRSLTDQPFYINYAPVPPLSVLAYIPFAQIKDFSNAKLMFNIIGFALFLLSYYRIIKYLQLENRPLITLVPAIFVSVILNNFYQGQAYFYLTACLLEAFLQWVKRRKLRASILFAIPIALKIFPVILLLFLINQKDVKTFFGTVFFSFFFSFSPAFFLPSEVVFEYFTDVLPRLFKGEINDPFTIYYQSAKVLINKLLVFDLHLNPNAYFDLPRVATLLHLLFQFIVLSGTIVLIRNRKTIAFAQFAIVVLAGLLLTGYGSSYSLLLLLPITLSIPIIIQKTQYKLVAFFLLFLACNVPIYKLLDQIVVFQFPRLYALVALLGLILLLLHPFKGSKPLKGDEVKVIGLVALLIIVKGLLSDFSTKPGGNYYLADGQFGIIHDYTFEEHQLHLSFLNKDGMQEANRTSSDWYWEDKNLVIKDHQIYLDGQQITFNTSHKKKAIRLNEGSILYLSDEGRGVGFYTLRVVKLNQTIN